MLNTKQMPEIHILEKYNHVMRMRDKGEQEGSFQSSIIISERGLIWHNRCLKEIQQDKEPCVQVFSMTAHFSAGK